jgi:cathepsin L
MLFKYLFIVLFMKLFIKNIDGEVIVDWRTKGVVTPVKNQGQCESMWAFSAISVIESAYAIKTGKLISLSEQQLIDCDTSNNGCNGGSMDSAFQYIIQNGGIDTEDSYPYEEVQRDCRYNPSNSEVTLTSWYDITLGDEEALRKAVDIGPVSAAIDASQPDFQSYNGGVYNNPDCTHQLDHAVTIVGYGHDNDSNLDYWIVKNTWGESWGDNGYIKMSRNQNDQCGIADMASYPII